jgi:peroxiredoxin
MAAVDRGVKAPPVHLPLVGGTEFSLEQSLEKGPVVLAFFKVSCPVCQFAFPYLERIYQAAKGKNVTLVGISQNSAKDTQLFQRQYGITFPVALDNPAGYAVSNAYGITNVPTIFYIAQDGTVEISCVGWSKRDVEEIAKRISECEKLPAIHVVQPGEEVPAFRAG